MRRTAASVNTRQCGQWLQSTYARHDRIRQKSLEGDTHGCGIVCSRWVVAGVGYAGELRAWSR